MIPPLIRDLAAFNGQENVKIIEEANNIKVVVDPTTFFDPFQRITNDLYPRTRENSVF